MVTRLQQVLTDREIRLGAVVDALQEGVVVSDAAGNLYEWNPAALEMHGYRTLAEAQRMLSTFADTFELSTLDGAIVDFEDWPLPRVLRGNTFTAYELLVRRKDTGAEKVLSYNGVPIYAGAVLTTGVITIKDVTEKRAAEAKLREAGAHLEALADNIDQLAWMADADGWLYWYNRRWYEYTGTEPSDMEGWGWRSVHKPEMLPLVEERWRSSIESGEPFDMEFPIKGSDGVYRPFLTRVHPLLDGAGKIVRWFGTNTDVSEHHRIQHELRSLRDNLAELVDRRTAELLRANERLQGFTYSLAHDFRQHIRGISINASLLTEDIGDKLESESREHLVNLVAAAKKMATLTDDLLKHAKLDSAPFHKRTIRISNLAKGVVAELKDRLAYANRATFTIQPDIEAMGDESLLILLLENLLDNACKFSSAVPAPNISFGQDGKSFYVRDNGIGIDMRYAHKLFQPFERLQGSSFEGSGIGLANVKRIVERHGGEVWIDSALGKGTTVYFTLPEEPRCSGS